MQSMDEMDPKRNIRSNRPTQRYYVPPAQRFATEQSHTQNIVNKVETVGNVCVLPTSMSTTNPVANCKSSSGIKHKENNRLQTNINLENNLPSDENFLDTSVVSQDICSGTCRLMNAETEDLINIRIGPISTSILKISTVGHDSNNVESSKELQCSSREMDAPFKRKNDYCAMFDQYEMILETDAQFDNSIKLLARNLLSILDKHHVLIQNKDTLPAEVEKTIINSICSFVVTAGQYEINAKMQVCEADRSSVLIHKLSCNLENYLADIRLSGYDAILAMEKLLSQNMLVDIMALLQISRAFAKYHKVIIKVRGNAEKLFQYRNDVISVLIGKIITDLEMYQNESHSENIALEKTEGEINRRLLLYIYALVSLEITNSNYLSTKLDIQPPSPQFSFSLNSEYTNEESVTSTERIIEVLSDSDDDVLMSKDLTETREMVASNGLSKVSNSDDGNSLAEDQTVAIQASHNENPAATSLKTNEEPSIDDKKMLVQYSQDDSVKEQETYIDKFITIVDDLKKQRRCLVKHNILNVETLRINEDQGEAFDRNKKKHSKSSVISGHNVTTANATSPNLSDRDEKCEYLDRTGVRVVQSQNQCRQYEDMEHVIELYDFPSTFKTQDLMQLYRDVHQNPMHVKWCDDTHALLVLSTPLQAQRALQIEHDIIKSRPLTNASSIALLIASSSNMKPAMKRPETNMQTARRMITTHLGKKSKLTKEEMEQEQLALRNAREQRRLLKQSEKDAWEGRPHDSNSKY